MNNEAAEAKIWLPLFFSPARSGYRIQVDPDGNATRAIYYMEQELSKFDPSRPANYNRCKWLITSCYSGHSCMPTVPQMTAWENKSTQLLPAWFIFNPHPRNHTSHKYLFDSELSGPPVMA